MAVARATRGLTLTEFGASVVVPVEELGPLLVQAAAATHRAGAKEASRVTATPRARAKAGDWMWAGHWVLGWAFWRALWWAFGGDTLEGGGTAVGFPDKTS